MGDPGPQGRDELRPNLIAFDGKVVAGPCQEARRSGRITNDDEHIHCQASVLPAETGRASAAGAPRCCRGLRMRAFYCSQAISRSITREYGNFEPRIAREQKK
jgi:predicted RNase H-like nuclease